LETDDATILPDVGIPMAALLSLQFGGVCDGCKWARDRLETIWQVHTKAEMVTMAQRAIMMYVTLQEQILT
jgi:hypothetical protein